MKNDELISIIIPVYNVEKYLEKSIESVLIQTYSNLEIILVDDGSTDNSGVICDQFQKKDTRVRVIHKKNGGLSDARNCGIKKSSGKYLTFMDSDDIISDDYIEYLYSLIKKYKTKLSICKYDVTVDVKQNKSVKKGITFKMNKILTLKHLLLEDIFTVSACAKMYSAELFDNITFPVGRLYEDNGTIYKLIDKCDEIAYGEDVKYFYIKRENSITTSTFSERKLDLIYLTDEMCNYLEKYTDLQNEIKKKRIASRFSIVSQLSKCGMLDSDIAMECIEYIKNNKDFILNSEIVTKREKIAMILLITNKRLFSNVWKLYEKIKYRGEV